MAMGRYATTMEGKTILFIDLDKTVLSNSFELIVFPFVTTRISNDTGLPAESIKEMLLLENRRRIDDMTDPLLAYDWDDIAGVVAERLGVRFDLSIERLVQEYAHPPYISMLEGVEDSLSRLRMPHRLVVAATNGLSKYQLPVLSGLRIDDLFDAFLAPDLANALKGCREYYGSLLGGAELAISVGDNYIQDIVAPKGLGMRTVWISRQAPPEIAELAPFERAQHCDSLTHEQVHPDAVVVSFAELPMVINEIENRYL
jgi:FMN phosphatase YigB (HAD superfamily)